MDLDELQSVQSRERQTDSLQQLRATFYQDAAEFIQGLETERDRAAERADDPWNSPEVGRLNDDIDTAEQTVEAIYERRVGKIVKMASLAAADMPTENEGLTEEERTLFETLVGAIEQNRDQVFAILDGESPVESSGPDLPETDAAGAQSGDSAADQRPEETAHGGQASPVDSAADPGGAPPDADPAADADTPVRAESEPDASRVDAADLMGGDGDDPAQPPERSDGGVAVDGSAAESDPDHAGEGSVPGDAATGADPGGNSGTQRSGEEADRTTDDTDRPDGSEEATVDRATVKITADVGEIFGVDERAYDLTEDDVVTLPEVNATPLVDSDAAERLD